MKAAVMQPYLFPYIGYYQLVNSVDTFVFYDDVNYIKRGYINRNNILLDGKAHRYTVPVPGGSQNVLINSLKFTDKVDKVLNTISHAYKKAPFYNEIMPIIERVLIQNDRDITSVCMSSIKEVFKYLEMEKTSFIRSTSLNYDREELAKDKLIKISKLLECDEYINSPGGRGLYDKDYFSKNGISLKFIETLKVEYSQNVNEFIPNLSMIDVLMWNNQSDIRFLLKECRVG